jgi:hypothetical protein
MAPLVFKSIVEGQLKTYKCHNQGLSNRIKLVLNNHLPLTSKKPNNLKIYCKK